MHSFSNPKKTENLTVFFIFSGGVEKGCIWNEWVNMNIDCHEFGLYPAALSGLYIKPGVVVCTCNPATLETEFRDGLGSIPVGVTVLR